MAAFEYYNSKFSMAFGGYYSWVGAFDLKYGLHFQTAEIVLSGVSYGVFRPRLLSLLVWKRRCIFSPFRRLLRRMVFVLAQWQSYHAVYLFLL